MTMAAEQPDYHPDDPPTLRAALAMLAAGLRPIPIRPGLKKPIGEGWGLRRYTPESLRDVWRTWPGAGIGMLLGDDGEEAGVIDLEVDDEELAAPVLARIFPDGLPDTLRFRSNTGWHYVLRFHYRLAAYGQTVIKGWLKDGVVNGNKHYLGVEFRLGTIDPSHPVQEQSVIPPTPREDGTPRQWVGPGGTLLIPEAAFDDPGHILPIPECVFEDLDKFARAGEEAEDEQLPPFARAPDPQWDKEEVKAALLADPERLLALVQEWGLQVTGKRATSKGFWECRAFDREDKNPSAAFNEKTGVYTDRLNSRDLSIFQLGVALWAYPDFHFAVNVLGRRLGVRPATKATYATKGGGDSQHHGPYVANVAFVAGDHGEDEPVEARQWPDPPEAAAWHGVVGEFAHVVQPYTEADPVGVLVQALVGWGNLIGRRAYFAVGATRHYLNLFACTTGPTATGRKGTAWDVARLALSYCDPEWSLNCVKGGLSSGEGLIWEIRDPIFKREPIREKGSGKILDYEMVESDSGIPDKRLLVVESELGGTLKVLTREGNTLSALVRQAWDSGMLRTMTKNNPARATDAHISIIGHITEEEVNKYLTQTDAANGFANRFLWVAVRQSKLLPRGALIPSDPIRPILDRMLAASQFASSDSIRLDRDPEVEPLWENFYAEQSKGRPGLLGAILGRATPQAMRIASLYALLDHSETILFPHLAAALALWSYCERSAAYIFGSALGDRDADSLLSALRSAPLGLSQSQIVHDVFRRHKTKAEVARILGRLLEYGLVRSESVATEGRPKTVWFSTHPAT